MKQIQPETVRSLQKGLLSLAVVVGITVSVPLQRAQAETQEQCQRRIAHAEHELHEAIERHGRHSRQAGHERRELRGARERCWREHRQWWDEHEHRWRQERDWNDHDHDRD
jgi:hypothetical protein